MHHDRAKPLLELEKHCEKADKSWLARQQHFKVLFNKVTPKTSVTVLDGIAAEVEKHWDEIAAALKSLKEVGPLIRSASARIDKALEKLNAAEKKNYR